MKRKIITGMGNILYVSFIMSVFVFGAILLLYGSSEEENFNNSHDVRFSEIIISIDDIQYETMPVTFYHNYYIVWDQQKIEVASNVFDKLSAGDYFVLHKKEWVNKDTKIVDRVEYTVE